MLSGTSGSEGSAVKSTDHSGLPVTGEAQVSEADKHRAMVLERCRKGRDEANRLGLFIKEKGGSMVRHLMMTGDLQQTKDSREGLEESLEKIHRSPRYLDKQVQKWERWYVLASTPNDETESSQVKIGPGKFSELTYAVC